MTKNNTKMISFAGDGIPTFIGMTRLQDPKEVSVGVDVKEACDCHPGGSLHLIATNPFSVIPAKAGTSSLTTEPFSVIPAKRLPPRRRGAGTGTP